MTHNIQTASIVKRFIAFLIDTILVVGAACAFLFIAMGKSDASAFIDDGAPSLLDKYQFLSYADGIINGPSRASFFESFLRIFPGPAAIGLLIMPMFYYVLFEGLWGGTIGKLLFGIRVRRKDGGKISFMTAFIRFIGRLISTLIFMAGYLLALFDSKRQTLHDKIANTMVLNKGTGI